MPLRLFSVLHDRECLLCPRPHCAIVFLHLPAQLKRCAFKFLLCPQHFHFASNCHKVTGHVVERFFYFLQNFTISLWAQPCKRIGCHCSFCTWAISEFLWSLERFSDRLHLFFSRTIFFLGNQGFQWHYVILFFAVDISFSSWHLLLPLSSWVMFHYWRLLAFSSIYLACFVFLQRQAILWTLKSALPGLFSLFWIPLAAVHISKSNANN